MFDKLTHFQMCFLRWEGRDFLEATRRRKGLEGDEAGEIGKDQRREISSEFFEDSGFYSKNYNTGF